MNFSLDIQNESKQKKKSQAKIRRQFDLNLNVDDFTKYRNEIQKCVTKKRRILKARE